MRQRLLFFIFLLSALLFAVPAFASTGFVDQPLWIYPESPSGGDMITLSALFHNAEAQELSTTVTFHDGDVLLGNKSITIPSGGVGTASVTFQVSAGDHIFSASVGNLKKTLSTGVSVPLPLSVPSAQLPTLFVTQNGSASGIDAVGLKASAVASPILDQVNQAENNVVSSIPSGVKVTVTQAVQNAEAWRTSNANTIKSSIDTAKKALDVQNKLADAQQKKFGKISASTQYVDRPLACLKLLGLQLLGLFYSYPIIFYLGGILILFLVLRSFWSSIARSIRNHRREARMAKIPKAPKI